MIEGDAEFAALLAHLAPPRHPDQDLYDDIKTLVASIGDPRIKFTMFDDCYVNGARRAMVSDGAIWLLGETGVTSERGVWTGFSFPVARVLNPTDMARMSILRSYLIEKADQTCI